MTGEAKKREYPRSPGRDIMSVVGADTSFDLGAASGGPDEISRRLESLPASSYLWRLVILLSLGGCFEIYDLFLTGYVAPGLNRSGLLTTTTQAFSAFPESALSSPPPLPACSPAHSS
jgi:hypothetical protein